MVDTKSSPEDSAEQLLRTHLLIQLIGHGLRDGAQGGLDAHTRTGQASGGTIVWALIRLWESVIIEA